MDFKNSNFRLILKNLRFVIPVIISIALFVIVIFSIILPDYKKSVIDRKKEMIKELTVSAWSTLSYYEDMEKKGLLTRSKAQKMAKRHISNLRYGLNMKDYFWISDVNITGIIHPYKSNIAGRDLTYFKDSKGKKIFVEFVKIAKAKGEGYLEYMWQSKADPNMIVPKLSFVKLFKPWGWIVGTGVYIEDVRKQISSLTRKLTIISIIILVGILFLLLFVVYQGRTLQSLILRDPLTGLYNRRYMDESIGREIHRAKRHEMPLCFLMVDIDYFKKFNDTYGHQAGDILLKKLGKLLKVNSRAEDFIFRYGGEEFTLIMSMKLEAAMQYAEKLREKTKAMKIKYKNQSITDVTISIGIASYPDHGTNARAILGNADMALYKAKEQGRDCVVVADKN